MIALARIDKVRFLANLNVFIPLFAYGATALTLLETSLHEGDRSAGPGPQGLGLVVLLAVLGLAWRYIGLAPRVAAKGRERRHQSGQVLLGLVNAAVVATAVLPLVLANLTGIEALGHLMWFGIPVLVIAFWTWPVGLALVWSSRGRVTEPSPPLPLSPSPPPSPTTIADRPGGSPRSHAAVPPARSTPMNPRSSSSSSSGWRVGHRGRDCMYYEERVDGRWERLEISGEMLMGPAHHVIYFDSDNAWSQYPAWARHRRAEIIGRIKSAFRQPDYEYQGG